MLVLTGLWLLSCDMAPARPTPDMASGRDVGSGCYPDLAQGGAGFTNEASPNVTFGTNEKLPFKKTAAKDAVLPPSSRVLS